MADSKITIFNADGGSADIDIRTVGSEARQIIGLGDPTTNANIAEVRNDDPGSSSTLQGLVVRLAGSATVVGLQGTTARPFLMNTDGAIKVYDIVTGTIATVSTVTAVTTVAAVTNITNSIAVHVLSTGGTIQVQNLTSGTVAISAKDGTFAVYFSPSRPIVLADSQHTAGIFTVSGAASGNFPSGITLVSPSANYSFKVFAFALTTTAQSNVLVRFTNGGGSPTEYWRYGLQAPSAGIAGANLSVSPPSYLFSTGTSTTLAILRDVDSLVHYSVSFIKESA